MAKRIIMISPFDVLTGNLSGQQKLEYAENNNPAYEAPNGSQGARNYKTRYIGARRADGTTYFSVRRKNTAVLNSKTRMQMALIGSIAAIKSTLKSNGTLATIKSAYDYIVDHGTTLPEGVNTFNKFVDYYLRDMLRYKREQWSFTQASISFTVKNPFKLDNPQALQIAQAVFDKFAPVLGFAISNTAATFILDNKVFMVIHEETTWGIGKSTTKCPNLTVQWTPITIVDQMVKYNDLQVYSSAGVAQDEDKVPAGKVFTTIVPGGA